LAEDVIKGQSIAEKDYQGAKKRGRNIASQAARKKRPTKPKPQVRDLQNDDLGSLAALRASHGIDLLQFWKYCHLRHLNKFALLSSEKAVE
jgi:hypothetical protein